MDTKQYRYRGNDFHRYLTSAEWLWLSRQCPAVVPLCPSLVTVYI